MLAEVEAAGVVATLATASGSGGGRGGGHPISSSFAVFFVFCSVVFLLFQLSSSVSLLGATGGYGEGEQWSLCRAEGGRRWFFFFALFLLCFFSFMSLSHSVSMSISPFSPVPFFPSVLAPLLSLSKIVSLSLSLSLSVPFIFSFC